MIIIETNVLICSRSQTRPRLQFIFSKISLITRSNYGKPKKKCTSKEFKQRSYCLMWYSAGFYSRSKDVFDLY
jgi:hypothetical protein